MSDVALRFTGVAKHYGRLEILSDISFDVAAGELFGLVGLNGAGKTTLLKCLLDFCDFDHGGIEIFGVAHDAPAARSRLAFLPERFNPPYFLTGDDFIRYVLEMHGAEYSAGEVARVTAAFDLEVAALSRPVRAYSKGMTQKLGLAACFLSHKPLYVLDEPTSGLDPRARALLKAQLRSSHALGNTVFFTSHVLADIAELCDRMAVVHGGRLRFIGTPDELCEQQRAPDLEQAFLNCIDAPLDARCAAGVAPRLSG